MQKIKTKQAKKRKGYKQRCYNCLHRNNADYCNGIGYWNSQLKTGRCWLK